MVSEGDVQDPSYPGWNHTVTRPAHVPSADRPAGNRLCGETSPYLLQHKDNPVHWMPWGEAALARARQEDKPIILSVGYAACHWCHVMAHESFEDEQIGRASCRERVCQYV